ncbi:MAG: hypothetical protein WA580_01445 [Acidimicrobiales bacterium]
MERFRAWWTTERVFDAVLVLAVIFITVWELHPNLIFSNTLITGGDTGSHLAAPAYLRTTGNPFDFTPWDPGWFDGFPLYTYYFVLPDVLATFASYIIGFSVAIKLATILGSVLLPICAYAMGRLFRAPRPIPAALALATLPFLFDASFTIDGGNLFSTMAGEYAFSLSLALGLLTIGLFARGMRTGKGFWLAAISLSLTLAAHVLPWMFTIGAVVLVLLYELAYRYGLFERDARNAELDGVTNRLAVLVASLCVCFIPFFFDTSFTTDHTGFLSARESPYSLIFTLLLVLFAVGRTVQVIYSRRGYFFTALAAVFVVVSFFVALRFALAMILVMTAAELVQRRDVGDDDRRSLWRGDQSRPMRFALGAGLLSVGLSAWWLFPFATSQSLTDSLGYSNVYVNNFHEIFSTLGWFNTPLWANFSAGDRWIVSLAGVSVIVAFIVRDRLGLVLAWTTVASFWAFALDPQSAIWNQRLIPFWYISIYLVSGWFVGYVAARWSNYVPRRRRWQPAYVEGDNITHESDETVSFDRVATVVPTRVYVDESEDSDWRSGRLFWATCVVAILGLGSTVPGLITPVANFLNLNLTGNQVSAWAADNYAGYQAQASWPEYHDIITTMEKVSSKYGCGRAMWEYSATENRFGTPEALMLLPYWTDNCVDSMEGLLMESSPTTPYHYLDQSELSVSPSDPQVGLNYGPLDVAEGVRHLQILGVKYFLAFSPAVFKQAAAVPDLKLIATTKTWPAPGAQWRVYLITHSPMVQSLAEDPNVVANISSQHNWLSENEEWWLTNDIQNVYAAESGPSNWPRATSINSMTASGALPKVTVTHVKVGLQSISFHVSRIGVPMLVKISYYPRWRASGATGPFRVSPNLMAVVPTSKTVSLVYGSTPSYTIGHVVSDVTVVGGLVVLVLAFRRRRRRSVD